jgi:hypothetical protein
MNQAGGEPASEGEAPAPNDPETFRFWYEAWSTRVRGPAISNPPRQGAPAETAARL